jgi:single-strand DNA-binding protein
MASNDLNRCEFIGRLGRDPEVRFSADGNAICNFSIAVGYKSKEKETTEWIRIVSFGKLAGVCGDYLRKGSQVYIAGRMTTRKWLNKDGVEQFSTEVVSEHMQMLGGKPEQSAPPASQRQDAYRNIKEGNVMSIEDDLDSVPF